MSWQRPAPAPDLTWAATWLHRVFLLLLLSGAASAWADHTPHKVFRHILPDQLETIGFINDIAQDAQGFMWFAGANGLARYDGYALTLYRNDVTDLGSLPNNFISDLLVTPAGELWIASRAGLQLYDPSKDNFKRYGFKGDLRQSPLADHVNQLWQDRKDRLWLATRSGLFQFIRATGEFRPVPLPGHAVPTEQSLWAIAGDESGYLWVGHESGGVTRYHPDLNIFDLYRHQPQNLHSLSSDKVRAIHVDGRDRVWIGTHGGGLNRFDRDRANFIRYADDAGEKVGVVWDVQEDKSGAIWVGDGESAGLLNVETGQLTRFFHGEGQVDSPGNYAVTSLFRDSAGDMWMGYFPSGVDRVDPRASVFRTFRHEPADSNSLADGNINAVFEDTKGNLWVGSGLGLTFIDRTQHKFTRVPHRPGDNSGPSGSTILSVVEDYTGDLWLGVWSAGLDRRDSVTGTFTHYPSQANNPGRLWGGEPWGMLQDSRRDLWIATELGLNRYNRATDDFTRFVPPPDMIGGNTTLYSRVVYEDSQNRFWWGTERGLFLLDRDTGRFTRYQHRTGDKNANLGRDFVNALYEDRFGRLWVGTEGGGVSVMARDGGTFTSYTVTDGLADDTVAGIKGDRAGAIWLITHGGLSRFDPDTNRFRNFDKRQGLPGNLFNRNAVVLTQTGDLAVGNSKGLVIFDPEALTENDFVPPVVLTELQVFNQAVSPRQEGSPLTTHITAATHLTLHQHQSVFAVRYAALNYRSSDDNQYAYRLKGFDADWNAVGNQRLATYTNLDPGEYHFEVRGSNNDGIWNPQPRRIRITVLAPLWATWWAYTLYCALAAVVLGGAYYFYRMRLIVERRDCERERERVLQLTGEAKAQDASLALACREMRTPLQGMTGLAEALIAGIDGPLSEAACQDIDQIAAGAQRLGRLIDDLTDLAALKDQTLELRRQSLALQPLVQSGLALVRPLLGDKPVSLHNRVPEGLEIYADPDRLQQILLNLLGHAVRFTDQGEIGVTAVRFDRDLEIAVADTGTGMDGPQLDLFRSEIEGGGAGIGLPLAQKLVDLHGGKIEVQSQVGRGTVFRILLPGAGAAPSDALALRYPSAAAPASASNSKAESWHGGSGSHILIVHDDPASLRALHHSLSRRDYRVTQATQGEQALAEVEKGDVDLVLLDLNMGRLSGGDTCRQIRQRYTAQELPVLILSAAARLEDRLAALEAGANDYLVKPATQDQLLTRIALQLRLAASSRPGKAT